MKQLNKTFIILQFGKPHKWTQKFIENVQSVKDYGFNFMIVTPNKFKSKGNVKILKMNIEQFNQLVYRKTGVNPLLFITKQGVPSYHVTDFMVGFGLIFEDFLKEVDFWGLIGIDCVVGRLDHFVSDSLLKSCEIYSDDINTFNGNFSLLKNIRKINNLFKQIPGWQFGFSQMPCPKCTDSGKLHELMGTDEYGLTKILREGKIKFRYPQYFIHGHDRLELHLPRPKLKIEKDGSLWEQIEDVKPPQWEHQHNNFGHEIAYFHFQKTKTWPI